MIIATYLVKNDDDILGDSISFHLNNGVDTLIVTENNPSKETSAILDQFQDYILCRIKENNTDFNQRDWVTRMARIACEFTDDAWIFHCDADELWHNLSALNDVTDDIVKTRPWLNHLPYSIYEFNIDKAHYYEKPTNDSWFGKGMQSKRKVIHKPQKEIMIKQGNHGVVGVQEINECPIEIHHYPVRTYEQFKKKAIVGGIAYEKSDLPEHMGKQWRRWYSEYKNGTLLDTYKSFLATPENIRESIKSGKIVGPSYV